MEQRLREEKCFWSPLRRRRLDSEKRSAAGERAGEGGSESVRGKAQRKL